jgi:glutamine amidotransferase
MCRLLAVKSEKLFSPVRYLKKFSEISKNSKEYQGHGWGFAYLNKEEEWKIYKTLDPIWEDDFSQFENIKTTLLLAHSRSAFKNKGIEIENNMPFLEDEKVFIFNGELKGVKIKEKGRIGAEKIFNYLQRFSKEDFLSSIIKSFEIIKKRTNYIRASNIIISDKEKIYLVSYFNEDPEYFTMHIKKDKIEKSLILCSSPFLEENDWEKIENKTIKVFG